MRDKGFLLRRLGKPFLWLIAAIALFLLAQFAIALVDELPKLVDALK